MKKKPLKLEYNYLQSVFIFEKETFTLILRYYFKD